mmetsp:Transcript_16361/g.28718  ORF Transcript_16361/g.28718 Transcript_16361/m.28718 type:complete len:113 (+) Transcript_16361:1352-1690(+)
MVLPETDRSAEGPECFQAFLRRGVPAFSQPAVTWPLALPLLAERNASFASDLTALAEDVLHSPVNVWGLAAPVSPGIVWLQTGRLEPAAVLVAGELLRLEPRAQQKLHASQP